MTVRITEFTAFGMTLLLAACAGPRTGTPDNEPTLASLAARPAPSELQAERARDRRIAASPEQATAAYQRFLDTAPNATQRAQALRRLGDLEIENAENQSARAGGNPDYRAAITRYQDYLKAYPKEPDNDRVLYQLARAYELHGQVKAALATLDQLVAAYPKTDLLEEAQFRRGELLFNSGQYAKAEQAYMRLLEPDRPSVPPPPGLTPIDLPSPFRDRALSMHGWSLYKQGRIEAALQSFFGVLDVTLAERGDAPLDRLSGLSRAERELVEDTLRVTSISLASLRGVDTIPTYIDSNARRSYEFRIHEQLGELYIKQGRAKDAADTLAAFARRQPLHAQAPVLQERVIGIYERSGLPTLALGAKKEYVQRYGASSEFRRANPSSWEATTQPLVRSHLATLARHYHATAQKTKAAADVDEAARWYREILASFPRDAQAASQQFLLAELLYDAGRYADAALEYDKAAYDYPPHAKSADAAYTALLAQAQLEKRATASDLPKLQQTGIASAERFGERFKGDPRVAPVLTQAAEKLYALKDIESAERMARQVLSLDPPAAPEQRRVAWTVAAHSAFERGAFERAEQGYAQALALTAAAGAGRNALVERQAAAIYKQGEQARAAGQAREAVAQFARVAQVAPPQSSLRAAAQYDAAATLIGLQDWDAAARSLEAFRASFPKHALQAEAGNKLAAVYLEQHRWSAAAREFERIAATQTDARLARESLWQAAELHDKAGARDDALRVYSAYARQYPEPFERQLEARWRVALSLKAGAKTPTSAAREAALLRDIRDADLRAGAARTERTRTIGGLAALALSQPLLDDYRKVTLVEPLAQQLKLKKARMETVLQAYAQASASAVAEVVTAATFHTAALYQDFGQALLRSQRPRGLKDQALEQYNVMLEEQAFPFEEKAIELHEANARRAATGLYDEWVRKSFAALRGLQPVRYGKSERGDAAARQAAAPGAAVAALERAVQASPTQARAYNELGIAYRVDGQFAKAREAYERALALDANDAAAVLNLGILHDLYMGDGAKALEHYERYLILTPGGDATVEKWTTDLRRRHPSPQSALDAQSAPSGKEAP